ncbi:MAG TPA: hypothetical protein VFI16_06600, partial [Anaeromyxobacteraceae bacterium]|nr:hypothetical protein [Anaeromyxobacteraceae bacterium]
SPEGQRRAGRTGRRGCFSTERRFLRGAALRRAAVTSGAPGGRGVADRARGTPRRAGQAPRISLLVLG